MRSASANNECYRLTTDTITGRFSRAEANMLDKSKVDKELARRFCAAFMSRQLGVTIATQYKNTPEDVGDLWYFLAALADKLARESQETLLKNIGRLATELIQ